MVTPDEHTPRLVNQLSGYTSIVAGHVESRPGVAYLELARPQRHNAFHEELWAEFPRALRELDAQASTRVIIVTGQGQNFCAGIDVGYLQRNFAALASAAVPGTTPGRAGTEVGTGDDRGAGVGCPGAQRAAMRRSILALQEAYSELERCRSPVVAAVHGRCIGGGVDLITACDLRLCSDDATFCVKEVDLAIAADLGTLQRLPHLVGHGVAMDLALTARTVGAEEARRIGLVSVVVPASPQLPPRPDETVIGCSRSSGSSRGGGGGASGVGGSGRGAVVAAALRLGDAIAAKPQLAVHGTKRVLLQARDQPRVSDGLDYVATWNSAQLLSVDLGRLLGGQGRAGMAPASGEGVASAGRPDAPPRSRL